MEEGKKQLVRSFVCIDIETTGTDWKKNRITQLAACKVRWDDATGKYVRGNSFATYVNPGEDAVWSRSAIDKTGISPEMVKDAPNTKDALEMFIAFIGDDDILTYNGNSFDLPFIKAECRRVGIEPLSIHGRKCYDGYVLESKLNSRRLENVYARYMGKSMEDAHDALNDVLATIDVFIKQQDAAIARDIDPYTGMNIGGMLGRNDNGEAIFLVGRYRQDKLKDIILSDPSYVSWFIKSSNDKDIFLMVKDVYDEIQEEKEEKKNMAS